MSGKEFRWGLCACGGFIQRAVLPQLRKIDCAEVIKAYDPVPEVRDRVAREFGIEMVDNYDAILDDDSINCVYVASPNFLHAEQTIAAAERGKHVFCQKPMARTADEARPMLEACAKAGVQLGVGFCYRYAGANEKMIQLIKEGAIGEPTLITINFHLGYTKDNIAWRCDPKLSGGGPLMDLAPHFVDLARFMMQDEYVSVFAHVDPPVNDEDVEQDTIALLRFKGGAKAVIDNTFNARHHPHEVIIDGTGGRLHAIRHMCWGPGGILHRYNMNVREDVVFSMHEHIEKELILYMDAIRQGNDIPVSGRDGLIANIVIDAIFKSGATGQAVKLDYA